MVPDSDYRIKLPVFEGPLDLLLFLIRKNEIDIYDIPIESVTKQYIAVIKSFQELDLEVAGEFFVMAATLMEIKSRMLLPKGLSAIDPSGDDDDAMDPRWELVHQLLQYKKFKEAALGIDSLATFQRDKLPRVVESTTPTEDERPLKGVDRIELWNSFNIVLRRLAEKLVVGEIKDEQITVSDQMEWILEKIKTEKSFIFSNLFTGPISVRTLYSTFLAVLELTRLKKLRVKQDEAFADILITAVEDGGPAFEPLPPPVQFLKGPSVVGGPSLAQALRALDAQKASGETDEEDEEATEETLSTMLVSRTLTLSNTLVLASKSWALAHTATLAEPATIPSGRIAALQGDNGFVKEAYTGIALAGEVALAGLPSLVG